MCIFFERELYFVYCESQGKVLKISDFCGAVDKHENTFPSDALYPLLSCVQC